MSCFAECGDDGNSSFDRWLEVFERPISDLFPDLSREVDWNSNSTVLDRW